MRRFALPLLLAAALAPASARAGTPAPIHHALRVTLDPAGHLLEARDTVRFPAEVLARTGRAPVFRLHDGLEPATSTPGVVLETLAHEPGEVPTVVCRLRVPAGVDAVELRLRGVVDHPLRGEGEEYARGQQDTPGIIGADGVVLSRAASWYPDFDEPFLTFDLEVRLPAGWDAVSQGTRARHERGAGGTVVRWESPDPQSEIYLVAGTWTEYARAAGKATAMVFLRGPDPALAEKFLAATFQYLRMYEELIGPYPYGKFAAVENFWETGFGMPSFTLLGPKVLRFPFILTSSYPHEILHSWWGNGVFIDYEHGNWGEGLTAYLADHLLKEQQGGGPEYRLNTLQKYADYVLAGRDQPLTAFRARHGSVSEAIGYGKSLMVFHQLRRTLGDDLFRACLRGFFRDHRFRTAGYADLQRSFEKTAGRSLEREFAQWVSRTGAPGLRVARVQAAPDGAGHLLRLELEQTQAGDAYRLEVPVAVTVEGRAEAHRESVVLDGSRGSFELRVPARPLRVDVDPEFDLFRRLDRREIPPALSQAFGAERVLIVLPAAAPEAALRGYRELAEALRRSGPGEAEVTDDGALRELPPDRTPWILGWENRFVPAVREALAAYDTALAPDGVRVERTALPRAGHAVVLAGRHPRNGDLALLWIGADDPAAVPGLARKLPHYHKYSYLGFSGTEPENVAKGRWPVVDSPLSVAVPQPDGTLPRVEMGRLPRREPLVALPPVFSEERLRETVRFLASSELQGRGNGSEGLERAAAYIAGELAAAGLVPAGDGAGGWFQDFTARVGDPPREARLRNVVAALPGTNTALAGESVVVAAHYDHLGLGWPDVREGNRGKPHPGADDNASGVAVLLELARTLGRSWRPERTVVFVAFAGEEAGRLGSRHYAALGGRHPAAKAIGVVNLDGVGRPAKRRLLVLGGSSAGEWVHIFRGAGFVTGVETAMATEELDASDQVSFREIGVPAVQLTTGPHPDYHRPTDTAEKLDAAWLTGVAAVTKEAVEYLAGRKEPLSAAAASPRREPAAAAGEGRKVSLGTVPDFAFGGPGVRLDGVVAGSPAEKAGLLAGDVLVALDGRPIADVKGFSAALKALGVGATVEVTILRDGAERRVAATLEAR
jgi:hypothetical protein